LVVIAIIAILASLLLPALGRSKKKTQGIYCMNNMRQLTLAWKSYNDDNNDNIVMCPFVPGWLDWTTSSDNTNITLLTDEKNSKLARYFNCAGNIFKCPADIYLSQIQRASGFKKRVRSISCNANIGGGTYATSSVVWDPIYKQTKKTGDCIYPGPAETWLFVDEHPDSINDAALFNPWEGLMQDEPAAFHGGACGFSFADGHAEIHKWRGCMSQPRLQVLHYANDFWITGPAGDPDIHWLSYHASRASARSY